MAFTPEQIAQINKENEQRARQNSSNNPVNGNGWHKAANIAKIPARYGLSLAGTAIKWLDKPRTVAEIAGEQGIKVLSGEKPDSWSTTKKQFNENRSSADAMHEGIDKMSDAQVNAAYSRNDKIFPTLNVGGITHPAKTTEEKRQALKNQAAATGFVVDTLVDAAVTKGLGTGLKLLKNTKAGSWAKGLADDAKYVANNLPYVSKWFSHSTGSKALDNELLVNKALGKKARRELAESGNRLQELHKAAGGKTTVSELESAGRSWAKGKGTKEQQALAKAILEGNAKDVTTANNIGVKLNPIEDPDYLYMPHILTKNGDKGRKVVAQMAIDETGKGLPVDKTVHGFQRKYQNVQNAKTGEWRVRNIFEVLKNRKSTNPKATLDDVVRKPATVAQINDYMKSAKNIDDFFSEDAVKSHLIGRLENQAVFDKARDLKSVFNEVDRLPTERPQGWRGKFWTTPKITVDARNLNKNGRISGMIVDRISDSEKLAELANTQMPRSLANKVEDLISGLAGGVNATDADKAVSNALKKYNSWYKTMTLSARPKYHWRNWIGDTENMWLGGMNPASTPKRLYDSYRVLYGNPNNTVKVAGKEMPIGQLKNMAQDTGVLDSGFFETLKGVDGLMDGTAAEKTLGQKFRDVVGKWGDIVSLNGEEARRNAMFLDGLNKGMTPMEAAKYVNNALFDYGNLTASEKGIREFIPFYSYTRNNVPFQLRMLYERPVASRILPRAKNAVEYAANNGDVVPEENRPEYIRNNFSVQFGKNEEGKDRYYTLGDMLPSATLYKQGNSLKNLADNVLASTTPLINESIKILGNYDPFKQKAVDPLQSDIYGLKGLALGVDKVKYMGGYVPAKVPEYIGLAGLSAPAADISRLLTPQKEMDTTDKIVYNATGARPYYVDRQEQENRDLRRAIYGIRSYEPGVSDKSIMYKIRNAKRNEEPELEAYYRQLLQDYRNYRQ